MSNEIVKKDVAVEPTTGLAAALETTAEPVDALSAAAVLDSERCTHYHYGIDDFRRPLKPTRCVLQTGHIGSHLRADLLAERSDNRCTYIKNNKRCRRIKNHVVADDFGHELVVDSIDAELVMNWKNAIDEARAEIKEKLEVQTNYYESSLLSFGESKRKK